MTTEIRTEWVHCTDCGAPIIERDGFSVDAHIGGRYGADQIDLDVEHECDPRNVAVGK